MKACVMRHGTLVVDEVPDPRPEFGQVLVRNLACGICGSDLHFLRHAERMVAMSDELLPSMGPLGSMAVPSIDLSHDIVMGHEFCGEILELGPDTAGPAEGTRVVSVPALVSSTGIHQLAYNNEYPGGYAERMLLSAPLVLEVPNGLDTRRAALTEPLAVGLHAVAKSGIAPGDAAVVVGCGPVGLAVIAGLQMAGVEVVVAADFSPARRALAAAMGASEVVDPATEPVVEAWRRVDGRRSLVAFEAVGVPGMLQQLMRDVPPGSRVTVVGVCMEPDTVLPFFAIAKELSLQFVLAYSPDEFAGALRAIAEGQVDVSPMITGTVDLVGVPGAFEALASPDEHVKILVEPAPA
ncbi:MAG TPA: zinc-binding dehydrogenase [Acidimicrobiales bacterium]|nr:zinc-binding dehydrogenase [Acidimicrobiales bacterium]